MVFNNYFLNTYVIKSASCYMAVQVGFMPYINWLYTNATFYLA